MRHGACEVGREHPSPSDPAVKAAGARERILSCHHAVLVLVLVLVMVLVLVLVVLLVLGVGCWCWCWW